MSFATRLPLLALALAACGPNYRYVYDGEAAFERCYALDFDDNAAAPTRQQCWSAWLQSYSFGAGADRVEYARAHAAGQVTPPAPSAPVAPLSPLPPPRDAAQADAHATPGASPGAPPGASSAWQREQISVGGNPVAAPPPTAQPASPESEPPGAACGNDCHATWHSCGTRCTGNDAACVARCDDGYRECMRGCF